MAFQSEHKQVKGIWGQREMFNLPSFGGTWTSKWTCLRGWGWTQTSQQMNSVTAIKGLATLLDWPIHLGITWPLHVAPCPRASLQAVLLCHSLYLRCCPKNFLCLIGVGGASISMVAPWLPGSLLVRPFTFSPRQLQTWWPTSRHSQWQLWLQLSPLDSDGFSS